MERYTMLGLLLILNVSFANDLDKEEPIVVYKKQTEIDFEALELEGELVKPQGALLLERKRANFNPLIKLRKDFDFEMQESTKDIQ